MLLFLILRTTPRGTQASHRTPCAPRRRDTSVTPVTHSTNGMALIRPMKAALSGRDEKFLLKTIVE
eukprot:1678118-Pyramimonas_sp.AAC.1